MGENRSGSFDHPRPQRGVQDSVLVQSTVDYDPHFAGSISTQPPAPASSQTRRGGDGGKGSDSARSCWTGFLQPDFSGAKNRGQMEANYRPLSTEPVYPLPLICDGNTTNGDEGAETRPLADISRSQRCLFPCADPPGSQEIPSFLPSGDCLAVQGASVRDIHGSLALHQGRGASPEIRSPPRGETLRVSGRLADRLPIIPGIPGTYRLATRSHTETGLGGKHGKVRSDSVPTSSLPGCRHRHGDGSSLSLPSQGQQMAGDQFYLRRKDCTTRNSLATHSRSPDFLREISSLRSSPDQTHSMESETELAYGVRLQNPVGFNQLGYERIYPVVAANASPHQRRPVVHRADRPLSVHGQQWDRLGGTPPHPRSRGAVDGGPSGPPHKCQGVESGGSRPTSFYFNIGPVHCCHNERQHQYGGVSQKSRGHTLPSPMRHRDGHLPLVGTGGDHFDPQTYSGPSERSCGSIEPQEPDSQSRVESMPDCSGSVISSVGSAAGRSVRTREKRKTSHVHVPHTGGNMLQGGRTCAIVEGDVRLRVPPVQSHQKLRKQGNLGSRRAHSDSSTLAAPGMVSGPPGSMRGETTETSSNVEVIKAVVLPGVPPKPSRSKSSRLEVISGFVESRGFSESVSNRIAVPQRQSTVKLYDYQWKCFCDWGEGRGVDPINPSVPNIAEFLLYLFEEKKLSVTTVKGYRSSISKMMQAKGIDISHNPDLNALCRSFLLERPLAQREVPRWDLGLVLSRLQKAPYEPMNTCMLADLTKKTAFLVMLATAKRTSEVWAFSADIKFGSGKQSATLDFLPGFIAKTQRADHPEDFGSVTIPALAHILNRDDTDRLNCPVRALRYYLDRTSRLMPKRQPRLFVSFKPGHEKDIAKATISGWLKAVIRQAYSDASSEDLVHMAVPVCQPRELRAIGTSLAFHQHHSITQVMGAATWRRQGTFAQHYLRDISSTLPGIPGSIVAAQAVIHQ